MQQVQEPAEQPGGQRAAGHVDQFMLRSPEAGEDIAMAVARRVREELGLELAASSH